MDCSYVNETLIVEGMLFAFAKPKAFLFLFVSGCTKRICHSNSFGRTIFKSITTPKSLFSQRYVYMNIALSRYLHCCCNEPKNDVSKSIFS